MKLMMHILSIRDHHKKTKPPQQINGEILEKMKTVVSIQTESFIVSKMRTAFTTHLRKLKKGEVVTLYDEVQCL